jgi:hypothetical protein
MSQRSLFQLLSVGLLLLTAGCGNSGDRPDLGRVSGDVTLAGKPLARAMVSFHPVEGGRQSCCRTDAKGHYQLTYIRDIPGARVGKHKVTVRTSGAEDTDSARIKELVPAKYNDKTTLLVEVKPGENQFNFDLVN